MAWCQYYDGGKAWLTTLGHDAHLFDADNSKLPGALEFQKFILGGIRSAMGLEPFCRCPAPARPAIRFWYGWRIERQSMAG